jgi:hypothetical protein
MPLSTAYSVCLLLSCRSNTVPEMPADVHKNRSQESIYTQEHGSGVVARVGMCIGCVVFAEIENPLLALLV